MTTLRRGRVHLRGAHIIRGALVIRLVFGSDITLNVSHNGQTISGADNFKTPLGGTTLGPNQTLGLGNVLFALSRPPR